jgi:hypothetical protein
VKKIRKIFDTIIQFNSFIFTFYAAWMTRSRTLIFRKFTENYVNFFGKFKAICINLRKILSVLCINVTSEVQIIGFYRIGDSIGNFRTLNDCLFACTMVPHSHHILSIASKDANASDFVSSTFSNEQT